MTTLVNPHIIGKDDYFTRDQPDKSEELVNSVEVLTQPLKPEAAVSSVYSTSNPIVLAHGQSYTLTAEYGSPPVMTTGATATITQEDGYAATLTILSSTFYPWGAIIIIENNDPTYEGSANISIEGFALKVQGQETISAEDEDSILDNGLQKYSYPKNVLIQSAEMAQLIADTLLASYKLYRKDVSVNWRGNPALELADTILVTEYERGSTKVDGTFKITKNQIQYDGTLNQITDGRKI